MGGSHAHGPVTDVPLSRRAVQVLLGLLALCAVATAIGGVLLWPDEDRVAAVGEGVQFAAEGVTFVEGEITTMQPPCPPAGLGEDGLEREVDRSTCGRLSAVLVEGPEEGGTQEVDYPAAFGNDVLREGDSVRLLRIPPQADQPVIYTFDGVNRLTSLWVLGVAFVLVVAVVARIRGILALISLGFGGAVLFQFMLPALLSGSSGLWVALTGASAIMFVVLYLTHGPSVRTSAALAGTLVGVAIAAGVGQITVNASRLTGVADEENAFLSTFAGELSFTGLLMCALVVAGLGILNDVTITQASAVWELRGAGPGLSRLQLFNRGMRIGRDHIASTIYTIVFAYAGSALAVLLLLSLYDRPILDLLTTEAIAQEIVLTLTTGIALVLAVPITTAIAALTVSSAEAAP